MITSPNSEAQYYSCIKCYYEVESLAKYKTLLKNSAIIPQTGGIASMNCLDILFSENKKAKRERKPRYKPPHTKIPVRNQMFELYDLPKILQCFVRLERVELMNTHSNIRDQNFERLDYNNDSDVFIQSFPTRIGRPIKRKLDDDFVYSLEGLSYHRYFKSTNEHSKPEKSSVENPQLSTTEQPTLSNNEKNIVLEEIVGGHFKEYVNKYHEDDQTEDLQFHENGSTNATINNEISDDELSIVENHIFGADASNSEVGFDETQISNSQVDFDDTYISNELTQEAISDLENEEPTVEELSQGMQEQISLSFVQSEKENSINLTDTLDSPVKSLNSCSMPQRRSVSFCEIVQVRTFTPDDEFIEPTIQCEDLDDIPPSDKNSKDLQRQDLDLVVEKIFRESDNLVV